MNGIATMNPIRYRGYYYDTHTGLYYLQSRYYDPEMGRFISPDCYVSTGQGLLGNNMYIYCNNNPVVGAESKLAGFVDSFLKYPHGGDGTAAVWHFVFQRQYPKRLEELPENTTQQRNIKALYLDGGCIYITGGFVADDALIVRGDQAITL